MSILDTLGLRQSIQNREEAAQKEMCCLSSRVYSIFSASTALIVLSGIHSPPFSTIDLGEVGTDPTRAGDYCSQ